MFGDIFNFSVNRNHPKDVGEELNLHVEAEKLYVRVDAHRQFPTFESASDIYRSSRLVWWAYNLIWPIPLEISREYVCVENCLVRADEALEFAVPDLSEEEESTLLDYRKSVKDKLEIQVVQQETHDQCLPK